MSGTKKISYAAWPINRRRLTRRHELLSEWEKSGDPLTQNSRDGAGAMAHLNPTIQLDARPILSGRNAEDAIRIPVTSSPLHAGPTEPSPFIIGVQIVPASDGSAVTMRAREPRYRRSRIRILNFLSGGQFPTLLSIGENDQLDRSIVWRLCKSMLNPSVESASVAESSTKPVLVQAVGVRLDSA